MFIGKSNQLLKNSSNRILTFEALAKLNNASTNMFMGIYTYSPSYGIPTGTVSVSFGDTSSRGTITVVVPITPLCTTHYVPGEFKYKYAKITGITGGVSSNGYNVSLELYQGWKAGVDHQPNETSLLTTGKFFDAPVSVDHYEQVNPNAYNIVCMCIELNI